MRLRIHDDGRWAVHTGEVWRIYRAQLAVPCAVVGDLHEPGWHEATVITRTDTDLERLADAIRRSWSSRQSLDRTTAMARARAVLDRLAEGGERDA
jgi:hypothetical protein